MRVGSAKAVITPEIGTPLGGNARANNYATRILQDLYARALWIESGASAVCLLALDLLGLWEHAATPLREAVAQETGISPHNVIVSCTHTHSGPNTVGMLSWSEEKLERDRRLLAPWWQLLTCQVVQAAAQAKALAQPSVMKIQFAKNTEIPHNRRLRLRDGRTVMNWTLPPPEEVERPLGPVDPQVTLLSFWSNETLQGALVHFACHPAILAGLNLEVSGDYCGLAMEELERRYASGNQSAFLFINGAMGNVNHIDYLHPDRGRDPNEVKRCGESLVRSVETAMRGAADILEDVPVHCRYRERLLPLRNLSADEIEAARAVLSAYDGRDLSLADGVPPEVNARKLLGLAEAARTGRYPGPFTTLRDGKVLLPLQLLRLGDVILGTIPGELFVEYALRFKQRLGCPTALLATVTNGYSGYIPTPEAFEQGGYEPTTGPSYLPPEAGEWLLEDLVEMTKAE